LPILQQESKIMTWKEEYKPLLWICGIFLLVYFMPAESSAFKQSVYAGLELVKWYAREHVLLCLVPAFFIAGTISVFVSQAAIIKYFGAQAENGFHIQLLQSPGRSWQSAPVQYCRFSPGFINGEQDLVRPLLFFILDRRSIFWLIILTARILGLELGLARVIGAVLLSVVVGLLMHFIYRRKKKKSRGPIGFTRGQRSKAVMADGVPTSLPWWLF